MDDVSCCLSLSVSQSVSFRVCVSLSPASLCMFLPVPFSASGDITCAGPKTLKSPGLH